MGDFIHALIEVVQYLWPWRIVRQWERAGYYVFGKMKREIGPGCYWVIPFFRIVHEVSVVPELVKTSRQDITIEDGSMVSFTASAWARVVDLNLAVNTVDDYAKSISEVIEAVLADRIAQLPAERLAPEKRGRLLADLKRWVQDEVGTFGIEVTKLRFTSFITNLKTHRLLVDSGSGTSFHL